MPYTVTFSLNFTLNWFYIKKNCQVLVKNLNIVAGMTWRFVSSKRLIRYFSNSSKLVEHHAQSPVREVKMLAVWPSIAEGFPTARSRVLWNPSYDLKHTECPAVNVGSKNVVERLGLYRCLSCSRGSHF